ncbi:MAG: hypothetical protein L3J74_15170, partial [Bacteroidales bacterium]|nr:hypothetical protein [Bacteroidales bacterium]
MVEKISSDLPKKTQILSQLGEPIKIKDKKTLEKYYYHFLLQTKEIENGYEDRTLNIVKLTFDKTSTDLVKMSGRFAGLKVSIDYRKYLENTEEHLAQIMEI